MAKIESGVCPYCNGTEVKYKAIGFDTFGNPYYDTRCCNCGKEYQECYSMDFQGCYLIDESTYVEKGTEWNTK